MTELAQPLEWKANEMFQGRKRKRKFGFVFVRDSTAEELEKCVYKWDGEM